MSAKKRQASTKTGIGQNDSASSNDQGRSDRAHFMPMEERGDEALLEPCMCVPLSTRRLSSSPQSGATDEQESLFLSDEHLVQTTRQLNQALRIRLREYFPRSEPLSLLVLHVSQLDQPALTTSMEHVYQKRRYHVTQDILAQVLNNVQRAVRLRDQLLLEEGVGAAMLFPSVDEQGMQTIVERIYRSICLLQAETIVPPLVRITDIVLGCGTCRTSILNSDEYSIEQAVENLLTSSGHVVRRLLLRPALATSLWETMPDRETQLSSSLSTSGEVQKVSPAFLLNRDGNGLSESETSQEQLSQRHSHLTTYTAYETGRHLKRKDTSISHAIAASVHDIASGSATLALSPASPGSPAPSIPFLHLPTKLSPRLKHLIPYPVAQQLQCAPVGRDHHKLTVAMANPTDAEAIQRLNEITGMTIFPVSCEIEALLTLLAERW
ncbi:MAG TPA: hypothetical protein DHW02_14135 [Ktedonobacter sp.]|nr:hypothetical protein [Ktedonobacter sp.]